MSNARELVEKAMAEAAPVNGSLALAIAQRRVSRRLLQLGAKQYRSAADLLDEAGALLPSPKGTDTSD